MKISISSVSWAAAAGLAIALSAGVPGRADTAMSPPIDCTKASAMMMAPAPESTMKSMGSVDKDFAQMMMMHNKEGMAMAKIEMACGKDAKEMAMAKAAMEAMEQNDLVLQRILAIPY